MLQRLTLDLTKDEREILDYTIGILGGAPGVDPDLWARAERLSGRVAADPALRSLTAKLAAALQGARAAEGCTMDLTNDERSVLEYVVPALAAVAANGSDLCRFLVPAEFADVRRTLGTLAAKIVAVPQASPAVRSGWLGAPRTISVNSIPVLWFGASGMGPDEFALELRDFPAEKEGAIPASLAIRVRSAGFVIGGVPLIDGGFMLHHESVRELHHQLGAWLAASAPPAVHAPETAPTAGPEES